MHRLHEGPGQIAVAVLAVVFALALAVRRAGGSDTAAVRRIVSDRLKSPNVSGLQHDRQRQNHAHTGETQQAHVGRLELGMLQDILLEPLDLLAE